ncbi:C40 family peptidase [Chondrinema litorale]|uniref:C40 family peptidase n=1 Tax=Chondrinema litorale TaxID=2994555 RepID=UPI002542BFAC|nr:C40 family peptidase [Chondrinema litorale]UZR93659.1 C40 family peptidase [Chondrinema litorale]
MRTKSEFDILLSHITNKELKQRLVDFRNDGIERTLDLTTDNPEKVINAAEYYLGTKHKMGGLTKRGMDCSGLIKVSFAQYGGELPHNSHEQGRYGRIIANRGDLQRGDLVFFINTYNSANLITHSGIYLGDGKFIHASSKKGVSVASVDDPYYWKDKYIFGTRVF